MCCRVGKCCFCIELRIGIIIIACLCLIGDALLLAWASVGAHAMSERVVTVRSAFAEYEELDSEDRDYLIVVTASFWSSVLGTALHSLQVLLDIMLLVGAIAARRNLLHGWMVAYATVYVVFVVLFAFEIALMLVYNSSIYIGLAFTAGILVHAGLMVYFWVVVRSYYLELCQRYGEGGARTTGGKVYRTVPTGDTVPAHGTYCSTDGMAMAPTAPPRYISNA